MKVDVAVLGSPYIMDLMVYGRKAKATEEEAGKSSKLGSCCVKFKADVPDSPSLKVFTTVSVDVKQH